MRRLILPCLLVAAVAAALPLGATEAATAEPHLSSEERAELVGLLEESRRQFEELTALSSGDDWSTAPAEGKWSVGEVAEHLVIAEEGIFTLILDALEGEPDPEWESTLTLTVAQLGENLRDRSRKFQAPESFQPTGERSRADLVESFGRLRARTLDFVRTTTAPLKQHTAEGPPGRMNLHQWLALIGAHNQRHNLQIIEAQEMLAAGG